MSGWIKLEKDLLTDPRVIRIGSKICNDIALRSVTLVLGGLAHLWMIADTHIGLDDVIPLGADEINDVIGIQGFCQLLPQDWLQVLDSNNVKLPGFHTHNGTVAKERAQTAKRVSKHRQRSNGKALHQRNGRALPDLDQDQDHKETPLPPNLDAKAWARWIEYRKSIRKPIRGQSLQAAAEELAKFGKEQGAVVQQSIANSWQGLFELKKAIAFGKQHAPNNDAAWAEARNRAAAISFRAPHPQESVSAYMTDIKLAESAPRTGPRSIAALAEKMRMPA